MINSIFFALGISAASGMIYQLTVANILFYKLINNPYSMATVISVFLLGLGMGSYLIYKTSKAIKNKMNLLINIQLMLGFYAFFVFYNLPLIFQTLKTYALIIVGMGSLLLPTILLGATFTLAGEIVGTKNKSSLGLIYALDILGAVIGTLIAGFIFIPILGNKTTLVAGGLLNLVAGLLLSKKKFAKSLTLTVVIILLFSIQVLTLYKKNADDTSSLTFSENSAYGIVSIRDNKLFINTREQCDLNKSYGEVEIVSQVLRNFPSKDVKALDIGLGCGKTASLISKAVDQNVDVVELNPVVIKANTLLLNVQNNPKINLIVDEGFHYLQNTASKYDAIIIDIEEPAVIHASNLYTLEAFESVKKDLKPNGIFGFWKYSCSDQRFDDILYFTLNKVFANIYQTHENVFIASDNTLPYRKYVPSDKIETINTIDKKVLSRIYLDKCSNWFEKDNSIESTLIK